MDALTLFGLFAVTTMLVCYAFEDQSPWFILAFAGAPDGLLVWFLAGRMAVRPGRSDLVRCSASTLAQPKPAPQDGLVKPSASTAHVCLGSASIGSAGIIG
jgi:hypothetical protein